MKQLTEYFNESLLDDEDDLIADQSTAIVLNIKDYLDKNTAERGYWHRFPEKDKKESYKLSDKGIHMADKYDELQFDIKSNIKEFPEYLNIDNGTLRFEINTKKFIINANLSNIDMIDIRGNVELLVFKKPVTGIFCKLKCPNLKTITMTKDSEFSNALDLTNCPNLQLLKCKFPAGKNHVEYRFTRDQISQLYKLIDIDPIKIKILNY